MCSAIKPKLGFRAARPLFKKEPNFPYFNDCNGLRPTTKIDSLIRRKPRNRLGLIVKIDADLKRTVVEYQRVRRRVLGEAGQHVAKTAAVRHHRNAVRD